MFHPVFLIRPDMTEAYSAMPNAPVVDDRPGRFARLSHRAVGVLRAASRRDGRRPVVRRVPSPAN